MPGRLPKRISLRGVFLVVAMVAVGLVCVREWVQLQKAREHYELELANLSFGQRLYSELVAASDSLYEAELATLWISRRHAKELHVQRLEYLAHKAETSALVTMFSDGGDQRKAEIREIRELLRKLKAGEDSPTRN